VVGDAYVEQCCRLWILDEAAVEKKEVREK
jgi:hypothetical protein